MEGDDQKKAHRASKSGRKADKKSRKDGKGVKDETVDPKIRNPKAFAYNSAVRAERKFRRTQDIETKKERVPTVDRTPVEPPPFIIAIVGPPKVGKSTLFQNLIKNCTRQTLHDVKGPVTIVSGKKRRLTLIECNNDINSMIDIAKVADLVLLLVDASFGFEMEIFEFLNICQVHGFPQIMGVLTHLDLIKNTNQLKKIKKTLKHRFWTEVYPGSKLFYLSGYHPMTNSYPTNEVHNLARFISVMKFRPTLWRSEHAYVIADRMEDITSPDDIRIDLKVDRTVCLYGYVHGTFLKSHVSVHIPGLGDYTPEVVTVLEDPCPLPLKDRIHRRSLNDKEKVIYAPFSGVGGIVYDHDAVYIDLGGSHSHGQSRKFRNNQSEEVEEEVAPFVRELRDLKSTSDEKMDSSGLKLFSSSRKRTFAEMEGDDEDVPKPSTIESEEEVDEDLEEADEGEEEPTSSKKTIQVIQADDGRMRRKVIFPNESKQLSNEDYDDVTQLLKNEVEQQLIELKTQPKEVLEQTNDEVEALDEGESSEDDDNDDEEENEKLSKSVVDKQANRKHGKKPEAKEINMLSLVSKLKARVNKDNTLDCIKGGTEIQAAVESDTEGDEEVESSDEDEHIEDPDEEENMNNKDENSDSESEHESTRKEFGLGEDPESIEKEKQMRYAEAEDSFYSRFHKRSLQKMVYDDTMDYLNVTANADFDMANCNVQEVEDTEAIDEDAIRARDLFVGGDYAEAAKGLLDDDDTDVEDAFGDFEELDKKAEAEEETQDEEDKRKPTFGADDKKEKKREAMKKKLKEKFDMEYDEGGEKNFYKDWKSQVEEQTKTNRTFFDNIEDPALLQELQGHAPGSYVRIQLNRLPYEFVVNFDPQRVSPLVIGSLDTPNQETLAVIQARVKKHRWHPKILKTRDPIILSVGWRRFQTVALYSVHDHNMRNRMIKYTPEHLHCVANFFGPVTPQGTGILGIAPQGFDGFRITLTGTILDIDKSTELVKKLKLIGSPSKIFKKSAFIDGMFNSQLEVAKFVGAKLKSVSGVRGVIKRPLRAPPGSFRATFEDKILLSDVVFCRTWAKVDIPKFFLSLPTHVVVQPRVVKTLGQLKRERDIKAEPNPDHLYTPIERTAKEFRPLKIPKKLQNRLPYQDKPKVQAKAKEHKRIAVIKEPHEREMSQMLKVMKSRMDDKESKEKLEKAKKAAERAKIMKKLEENQTHRQKELRKKVFRTLGQMNKNKDSTPGGNPKRKFQKRR